MRFLIPDSHLNFSPTMDSSTEITHDFSPFLRVYKDGRIERLLTTPRLPPSTDPITGVQSKDALISSDLGLNARIFVPKISDPKKLPLIVYTHGGGFCIGSPFNIVTHGFLTPIVSQTPAIAVAVQYRLAPEHHLPIAHQDCWAAFQWIASHSTGSGPEPWLNECADFGRVFLVGESAGANLAHYLAVQAGVNINKFPGLGLRSLVALHPYFSQKEHDKMIQYFYPGGSASDDDPKLNPKSDPDLEKMGCSKVLIVVAEKDYLKARGLGYKETLDNSKWRGSVECMENHGEDHCFYLFNPTSEKAKEFVQDLISYIKKESMVD